MIAAIFLVSLALGMALAAAVFLLGGPGVAAVSAVSLISGLVAFGVSSR